jgi:hypothetical protein
MAVKKKKIDYTIWVLGAAAVGLLGYVFKDDIKKLFAPKDDTTNDTTDETTEEPVKEIVVTNGGVITTSGGVTTGLSGMGTPKDRLNLNQNLKKGDKGQEVAKLQQILNRIAKITGSIQVTEDGVFGSGTEARLNKVTGNNKINLYKAYIILFAIWNAKNNKDLNNWFKKYYEPYLNNPERLKNARTFYFANNQLI